MEIIKEFAVKSVTLSNIGPHTISLETKLPHGKCLLAVDKETCERYGIDIYDLEDKTLVCTFESYEPRVHQAGMLKGEIDEKRLDTGCLFVQSMSKTEKIFPADYRLRMTYVLELETKGVSHYDCPFYHFDLELTWNEYEECRKLPPVAVFRPRFHVICDKTHGGVR